VPVIQQFDDEGASAVVPGWKVDPEKGVRLKGDAFMANDDGEAGFCVSSDGSIAVEVGGKVDNCVETLFVTEVEGVEPEPEPGKARLEWY
jgi:hypothetical protein